GVSYFGCSLENAFGKIFARDMANNKRLEEITNPFNPVKIPMDSATTRITRPNVPSSSCIAAPVPHTWFSATTPCQGSIIPVAIIIKLYNTAAKKMARSEEDTSELQSR